MSHDLLVQMTYSHVHKDFGVHQETVMEKLTSNQEINFQNCFYSKN